MYDVQPDNKGQWILYKIDGADFLVVAWFVERGDAEFAKEAFEKRAAGEQQPASHDDTVAPAHVTSAKA